MAIFLLSLCFPVFLLQIVHWRTLMTRVIRQGGMGVYISTPRLAKAVSLAGGIGTVSGTLADHILARLLHNGDPGGDVVRALSHFPVPEIAEQVIQKYLRKNTEDTTPLRIPFPTIDHSEEHRALIMCANFALVWLAKEGHAQPIAINYLEKVQLPFLYALAGAMLAGVDEVVIGAGIPTQVPGIIDSLYTEGRAEHMLHIEDSTHGGITAAIDIHHMFKRTVVFPKRPDFLPIVSTDALAHILFKKTKGNIQGLIIEHFSAGGHNAPPRGKYSINELGEPIYSERDTANMERIRELEIPFWLAGGYHSKEKRTEAEACGASGVQIGSLFALAEESGLRKDLKHAALTQWKTQGLFGVADTQASPTGFPFRIVALHGTTAEKKHILSRTPQCNIGALLSPYFTRANFLSYRCPAEPSLKFEKKGGDKSRTEGVVCLCNALLNACELGIEGSPAALTLGSDCSFLTHLLQGKTQYSVADAMEYLCS